jgi:hypothetical protein
MVVMKMKEYFEVDALADGVVGLGAHDDFVTQDFQSINDNFMIKNMTHRRQIEIMRENKILMSSIKDIYDY